MKKLVLLAIICGFFLVNNGLAQNNTTHRLSKKIVEIQNKLQQVDIQVPSKLVQVKKTIKTNKSQGLKEVQKAKINLKHNFNQALYHYCSARLYLQQIEIAKVKIANHIVKKLNKEVKQIKQDL